MANCTRHGGWTEWSDWGACSSSCDAGVRTRSRTCGNPAPAFGGAKCVGTDIDRMGCENLPKCGVTSSIILPTKQKGQWGRWGEWSECSSDCGKGVKSRKKECLGGNDCQGCGVEYQSCVGREGCSDMVDVTDWTPWIRTNASVGDAWYEKRYRFQYGAPVSLEGSGKPEVEERFCQEVGRCSATSVRSKKVDEDGDDRGPWTEWSACSRECGTGYQIRARECARDKYGNCREGGMTVSERPCNIKPCQGEWGCWSDWSECQSGVRRRARECKAKDGMTFGPGGVACRGGFSYEEKPCDHDSLGRWGEWGECGDDGRQSRMSSSGLELQTRNCEEVSIVAKAGSSSSSTIIAACVCCFLLGALVGVCGAYYLFVKRRYLVGGAGGGGNGGNPHYVSAKSQNLYVSLPMLDLKNRNFSSNQSDCSTLRSTTTAGTLRSTRGGAGPSSSSSAYAHNNSGRSPPPLVDYETATIKRSHSQRNSTLLSAGERGAGPHNGMRADLDSDQLFT